MLSARSIYNSEAEFYGRPEQQGMSLGHSSSLGDQYDNHCQLSRNNSPQSDPDNKSPPPRKRVPVACGRCRKRKIKCSGDEGGNRGCSNCRNAGFAGCQFLRVQSSELPVSVPYQPLKGWQMSHRFSPYSSGFANRYKPFTGLQYTDSLTCSGLSNGASLEPYPNPASPCAWIRPSHSPQFGLTYADETPCHFTNPPPPSYMLPHTDPMTNMNSCYLNSSIGRAQSGSWWADQVSSTAVASTLSASGGNHLNTAYGLQGTEIPNSFNAVSGTSTDRILPTPSASRTLAAAPQSSLDSQCLSALSHRSSLGWSTDTQSSTSGTSSRTTHSTESESRIVSSGSPQDVPFGYTLSPSAQDMAETTARIDLSQSPHGSRCSPTSQRMRNLSRDSNVMVPSPTESTNYHYISSSGARNHQSASAELTNGVIYRRVPSFSSTRGPRSVSISQDCVPEDSTWNNRSQRGSLSNSSSFSNLN